MHGSRVLRPLLVWRPSPITFLVAAWLMKESFDQLHQRTVRRRLYNVMIEAGFRGAANVLCT